MYGNSGKRILDSQGTMQFVNTKTKMSVRQQTLSFVTKIQTHPLLFGYAVLHLIHSQGKRAKRTEQYLYMKNTCQKLANEKLH